MRAPRPFHDDGDLWLAVTAGLVDARRAALPATAIPAVLAHVADAVS